MKTNSCPSRAMPFHMAMIVMSLLLVGCTIQVNTTIESDGSGIYSSTIGFTDEEKSSLESANTDVQKLCDETRSDTEKKNPGKPVTARVEEQEGITQCIVEIAFNSLDELRQIYEQPDGGITVNRLELKDNQLIYDITITGGSSEDSSSELSQLGGLIAGAMDVTWQVKMPGRISNNNADEIENNVLIWKLDMTESARSISAESRTGGLSLPIIATIALSLLCIFGIAAGVIGGLVFWRMRKRKALVQISQK